MGFLRRAEPRAADVGVGFVAAEAPALQASIVGTLSADERRHDEVATTVQFARGTQGRVVVVWRNRNVGFAPAAAAPGLLAQLDRAGRAGLVAPATVRRDGEFWRVVVGGEPGAGAPLRAHDELEPPPFTLFGVPLGDRLQRRQRVQEPATTWVLTIDDDSWDVRDGVDADLSALRARIASSAGRGTLHLRIGDDRVAVRLADGARVELTGPDGSVEVLHPTPEP